jgi:putative ABC transport system permease protein
VHVTPILAALRHHRLSAGLIAVQIALVCAVLCNACSLIAGRMQLMDLDSGVDESSLALVQITGYDPAAATDVNAKALGALRAIPGVQAAEVINTLPFGPRVANAGIDLDAAGERHGGVINFYVGGPSVPGALGLKLVAGRWPAADEYGPVQSFVPADAPAVITQVLAEHLWPGADPLGREFWVDKYHFRVIGVLDHLAIPAPGGGEEHDPDWSTFVPGRPGGTLAGSYLLRADPRELPGIYHQAEEAIGKALPDVVFDHDDSGMLPDLRHHYFAPQRTMTGMLAGVILALLLVTSLGIVGLASFWVSQRHRQIGIRRALGATRGDILHYFQVENFLIVGFGVVAGLSLTIALNIVLIKYYGASPLPAIYLPLSAVVVWLLGQLAVLKPALQAAAVPPAVATRGL